MQKKKIKLRCDGKKRNLKSTEKKGLFLSASPWLGVVFLSCFEEKKSFFRCQWKIDKDGLEKGQGQMSPIIPGTSKLLF